MFLGALLMFGGLAMTVSVVLVPIGIFAFITGATAFISGAIDYFSALTKQEEKWFVCILPIYIQTLATVITMGIWGHLVRPLFQLAMDYIGGIGTVVSIADCIEKVFSGL